MTRPTTDGDTAEVHASLMLLDGRTIDAWESHEAWLNGLDALERLTTRLSEQEVELERAKDKLAMLEQGANVARACSHHGSEDCDTFECAAGDCHFIPAEHLLAAIHGDLPARTLARFLGNSPMREG